MEKKTKKQGTTIVSGKRNKTNKYCILLPNHPVFIPCWIRNGIISPKKKLIMPNEEHLELKKKKQGIIVEHTFWKHKVSHKDFIYNSSESGIKQL